MSEAGHCRYCGADLEGLRPHGPGRQFCSRGHLVRFYSDARRWAQRVFDAGMLSAKTLRFAGAAAGHGPAALAMRAANCLWCDGPLPSGRRHGSERQFCQPAHRHAFQAAARQWASRMVELGLISVADLAAERDARERAASAGETEANGRSARGFPDGQAWEASLCVGDSVPLRVVRIFGRKPGPDAYAAIALAVEAPGGEAQVEMFFGERMLGLFARHLAGLVPTSALQPAEVVEFNPRRAPPRDGSPGPDGDPPAAA